MLWYNRRINPLFKSYFESQSIFHNLSNPFDRIIFICKCLGYLDCLYNGPSGLTIKDYFYLRKRLLDMITL